MLGLKLNHVNKRVSRWRYSKWLMRSRKTSILWTQIQEIMILEKFKNMMTSSNGNIFRVTGPLCGEFTGHRWIPHTKAQWRGALKFSLICIWINTWGNNAEADDLRRYYDAHYDVIATRHQLISARPQQLQCVSIGATAILRSAIDISYPNYRGFVMSFAQ